ncbi:MAG: putative photosynthetic complex assembly protein PuhE [Pseudomonadota bacterium]
MMSVWIAGLVAVFLWWFSTGAILVLVRHADKRGAKARMAALLGTLPLLGVGIWGFSETLHLTSVWGAYGAFLSALAIWGWAEISFLTGAITGPNGRACPPDVAERDRFWLAWGTIAYHELLLTVLFGAIWIYGADAANSVAILTFSLLYFARISAKLNLYMGVRKINAEFFPGVLDHLPSHFRIARLNWVFPISVTLLSWVSAIWFHGLIYAATPGEAVGQTLLFAITLLALLEHWLMVLPLPDAELWRWMLPDPQDKTNKTTRPEGPNGF